MNGDILKELRKNAKMSQVELAKILQVSPTSVRAYEQGRNTPSDEIKVRIAKYFNRSLDYLLGVTKEELPLNREDVIELPVNFPKSEIPKVLDYIDLIVRAEQKM